MTRFHLAGIFGLSAILSGGILSADAHAAGQRFRICYISLNNEKERPEMERFVNRLNESSTSKIEVVELQPYGANPEATFKTRVAEMAQRGEYCNGLVFSGHHTGSFAGKRGSGVLGLDTIESMSCDPKYQGWFEHVNALWLQGCRTYIDPGKIQMKATTDAYSADYHTFRVGSEAERDNLPQGRIQFNQEFTQAMDPDNPISSRYRRAFPAASVFGWSWTGPGTNAKSEYSILNHIAHISRMSGDRDAYFVDPKGDLPEAVAARYANILTGLLSGWGNGSRECENLSVEAWKAHGRLPREQLGFGISEVEGGGSLLSSGNSALQQAKQDNCALRNSHDPKEVNRVLDRVLASERSIGYNFNLLLEMSKDLDNPAYFDIQKRLSEDEKLRTFLQRKIGSKQTGILPKIEYYAFYKKITNEPDVGAERTIKAQAREVFEEDDRDSDLLRFQQVMTRSLEKHGLMDPTIMAQITRKPRVRVAGAPSLIQPLNEWIAKDMPRLDSQQRLAKVRELIPHSSDSDLGNLLYVVSSRYPDPELQKGVFEELKRSGRINSAVIDSAIASARNYGYRKVDPAFFTFLANSPAISSTALEDLSRLKYFQLTDYEWKADQLKIALQEARESAKEQVMAAEAAAEKAREEAAAKAQEQAQAKPADGADGKAEQAPQARQATTVAAALTPEEEDKKRQEEEKKRQQKEREIQAKIERIYNEKRKPIEKAHLISQYNEESEFYRTVAKNPAATPSLLKQLAQNHERSYSAELLETVVDSPAADLSVVKQAASTLANNLSKMRKGQDSSYIGSLASAIVNSKHADADSLYRAAYALRYSNVPPYQTFLLFKKIQEKLASGTVADVHDYDLDNINKTIASYMKYVPEDYSETLVDAINSAEQSRAKRLAQLSSELPSPPPTKAPPKEEAKAPAEAQASADGTQANTAAAAPASEEDQLKAALAAEEIRQNIRTELEQDRRFNREGFAELRAAARAIDSFRKPAFTAPVVIDTKTPPPQPSPSPSAPGTTAPAGAQAPASGATTATIPGMVTVTPVQPTESSGGTASDKKQ